MKIESDPKNDLWAFREGRKSISGTVLFGELAAATQALCAHPADRGLAISALMLAGEFESGVADVKSPAQSVAQELTDALARAFLGGAEALNSVTGLVKQIGGLELPQTLSVSPPEGFAYYALHPHDFSRLAQRTAGETDSALIVGIRSIGTTLSAIVHATLSLKGKKAERITVRPTGHPYERCTRFNTQQLRAIDEAMTRKTDFMVVDEGPGRSGSSFLSVAEALTNAGVPPARIVLLGSRPVNVSQLCAENAPARWSRFRFVWPESSVYTRFSDHIYIGGGNWREILLEDQSRWPACWPQMERLKFLSPDRRSIFKFEGFGRFGEGVLSRAEALAKAGFSCPAENAGDGMMRYPRIHGTVLQTADVSRSLLEDLARYCAFRAAEFRVADPPPTQLPAMLKFNALQEFGIDLGSEMEELCTGQFILTDARMQAHEWIRGNDARVIKLDACTHGDDHFFPGPADIAWDLAGAIVEWNLDEPTADFFLSEFRKISGIDRSQAISAFTVAYIVFRLAYWKMALPTVAGSAEEDQVLHAYRHYRTLAERQLSKVTAAMEPVAITCSGQASVQSGTAA